MKYKGGISPFKGMCTKQHCDKTNPQVCLKMKVVHVEMMSAMSGLLIFKRSFCFKGKCSVFKVHFAQIGNLSLHCNCTRILCLPSAHWCCLGSLFLYFLSNMDAKYPKSFCFAG